MDLQRIKTDRAKQLMLDQIYRDIAPLNRKQRRTAAGKLLEAQARIAVLEAELEMMKDSGYEPN